jgi:hypothetical protein
MRPISIARMMAVMAAPMLLGCGAQSSVGATVAGLPADFEGPGTYTVPEVPAAPFALASVRIEQSDGTVSVYYDLPADLVGQVQKVELTGVPDSAGTLQLSGAAGTSTCTVSATLLECDEHLSGIHIDAAQASSDLPPGDPRIAAVEAFGSDPIGVLRVALPGAPEPAAASQPGPKAH